MVLLSALLHAGWNVVAKRSERPTAFLYLLTAVTLLGALAVAPLLPLSVLQGELLVMLLASCALHGLSFIVLSRAYEAGDLSLVYPISRSTPALVPLLAIPWLGERVSALGAAGIGLTLLGMWLVQTGGAVRWQALRQPAALWAYLMLVLTAGFSLVDKRAMALLSNAPWQSPVPRALAYYLLQTAGAALVCAPYALKAVGARELAATLRAARLAGRLRRACHARELRADSGDAAHRPGQLRGRRPPVQRAVRSRLCRLGAVREAEPAAADRHDRHGGRRRADRALRVIFARRNL